MKNLLKTTVVTLALVTIFASASLATTVADEYEFTALDNDVVIKFPGTPSHEECNNYAILQNRVDLVLGALGYDQNISAKECTHPDHTQNIVRLNVESTLTDLGFDG